MIYFLADDHYGARPGAVLHEELRERYEIVFSENDFSCLEAPEFSTDCNLLILNMIAGTCGLTPPGNSVEVPVRAYLERGKPLLLLHGASAAFWHWDWWRPIVGFRWVRNGDPDGARPSRHPISPYRVNVSSARHPLCGKLQPMDCPEDEIYIGLEQTSPALVLMETTISEGTFPQCWESASPWGGRIIGFLPGHRSEVLRDSAVVTNVCRMIDSLLSGEEEANRSPFDCLDQILSTIP